MDIEGYVGKTVDPRTSGRLSSEISRRDFLTEANTTAQPDDSGVFLLKIIRTPAFPYR